MAWPTAQANDSEKRGDVAKIDGQQSCLATTAPQWKSPAVQEPGVRSERLEGELGHRMYDRETGRLAQTGLSQQVEMTAGQWQTPNNMAGGSVSRGHDRIDEPLLAKQAEQVAAEAWTTPRSSDGEKGGPNQSFGAGGEFAKAVEAWPTPRASMMDNGNDSGSAQRTEQGPNPGLKDTAEQWPTVAATETRQGYQQRPDGMASEQNQQSLTTIATDFLSSLLAPEPSTSGEKSCESVPGSHRRRLSPIFVAWLMGWPLTALGCSGSLEMVSSPSRQPTPSVGSGAAFAEWERANREALRMLLS